MTWRNTHLRAEDFPPPTKPPRERRHICSLCGFDGIRSTHGKHDFGTEANHDTA